MALNPFFLQGPQGEQRLVQDLINEQLQIYGVEVTYIPRKMVNRSTIIEEVMQDKLERVCHEMECSRDADITYELVGFHFKVSEKKYKEIMKSRRLRAVALEDK